jgi:hypothetical protein
MELAIDARVATSVEQWGHNLDELHARYISAVNPGKGTEVVGQIPSGPGRVINGTDIKPVPLTRLAANLCRTSTLRQSNR